MEDKAESARNTLHELLGDKLGLLQGEVDNVISAFEDISYDTIFNMHKNKDFHVDDCRPDLEQTRRALKIYDSEKAPFYSEEIWEWSWRSACGYKEK